MIVYILLLSSTLLFCWYGGLTIIKDTIVDKYERFRELNSLVETQHKNKFKIFHVSINMIFKMWWINFLQKTNNTVHHIDNKSSIISYVLDGRLYKIHTKRRKGPVLVLLVIDHHSKDVSNLILPFLGPQRNWHNTPFTPSFWNKDSLTFELSSGETKTFSKDEVIIL